MHTIKPIEQVGHDEIVELARAAADRGESLRDANPFAPGTSQHLSFTHWYWARHRELHEVEA
jgi:hypothetical protein